MNTYKYKAVSRSGSTVTGVLEAYDEFEAVARIKQDGGLVLKIESVPEKRERIDLNEPLWVSEKVLALTASQFAILLKSGLPMVRTVEIIAQQTADRLMKKILKHVAQDVAAGYGLAQSFESRGKKIPTTFIETIRAGEESGTLEACFAKLEQYYTKSHKTKSKVRSALMYPIFLCILAIVVVMVIMVVTVPKLLAALTASGKEMPAITQALIDMSGFFANWWWLVVMVLSGLVIFLRLYARKTESGRVRFGRLALKIPIMGRVNRMKAASQFANTLSTLLAAGLPSTRAVAVTAKVLDNYAVGLSVGACVVGLEAGKRLGDVLGGNPYLPPLLTEMVCVGEESGALEDTLNTIGAYYASEAEAASTKVLSMLEPSITVIMGVMVGFIVLAIYAGMFASYGA